MMPCRNLEGVVINVPFKSQSIISKPKELYKGKVFKKKTECFSWKSACIFPEIISVPKEERKVLVFSESAGQRRSKVGKFDRYSASCYTKSRFYA